MSPAELDEVCAPGDDSRLRASQQLVSGDADEIGARGDRLARGRLVREDGTRDHRARAEIVDQRQSGCVGELGQRAQRGLLLEADDAVVRRVHAQDRRGLRADRSGEVGRPRAVRRADLAQPCARAGDDLGNAKAIADLDELAARDDHLAAVRDRRQAEHESRGAVVNAERVLGSRELAHERRDVRLA